MHFTQKQDESIYQTWERFKETLLQCPHHGYTMSNLLAFFYNGLTPKMKEYVELMCNGQFFKKTQYDAWAYIETIAEHATRWEPRQEGFDRLFSFSWRGKPREGRFNSCKNGFLEQTYATLGNEANKGR